MLRIYKNYATNINYIGNGLNSYIINTNQGSIISKSFHSSLNYSNNYNYIQNKSLSKKDCKIRFI